MRATCDGRKLSAGAFHPFCSCTRSGMCGQTMQHDAAVMRCDTEPRTCNVSRSSDKKRGN